MLDEVKLRTQDSIDQEYTEACKQIGHLHVKAAALHNQLAELDQKLKPLYELVAALSKEKV